MSSLEDVMRMNQLGCLDVAHLTLYHQAFCTTLIISVTLRSFDKLNYVNEDACAMFYLQYRYINVL